MARQHRLDLIRDISSRRNSALICYITGDRENINTRIAPDVTPIIYRHLEMIKHCERLDLLIYTRGGDVLTPWRLVHLVREYAGEFAVLVPFRAYSAGTLICLGADEIVMGKMGELGPIDPSVVNAFNPQDPCNPSARVPVNIEDVYSYLALAREKAGLASESELARSFIMLAGRIHPLALGNVHRNYLLIRSLANKLLDLRKTRLRRENVQNIVDNLTEKLYAHNHMIPRREAVDDIGLPVTFPDQEMECLLWELYQDYARDLELHEPFNPSDFIRGQRSKFEVSAGIVESVYGQDCFMYSGVVERNFPENGQTNVNILSQGWRKMF